MKPFIPIYPGILDYLLRGDISRSEFGLYVVMHAQADFSTGIWTGSAPRIAGSAPRGAELRAIQREMQRLADIGLVKHFHKHGARGNFPWLINKYICRFGALRGKQLNAALSTSLRDLRYESCAESDAESVAVSAPYQEVRVKREEKLKPPARVTPEDSLQQETQEAGFAAFWECWPRKQDRQDAIRAWMKIPLAEYPPIMAGLEKWKKSDQWTRGVIPHASTWLNQKRWQDEDVPQKGANNGNRNAAAVRAEPSKYANVKPIRAIG